jgi:hypothetical protein
MSAHDPVDPVTPLSPRWGHRNPADYVVMGYHQGVTSGLLGDPDYRPGDWTRAEFREGEWAGHAREAVELWLLNTPVALAHAKWLTTLNGRGAAGTRLAHWLDWVLYGPGIYSFPSGERGAVQLVADEMARKHFCRMNFGVLLDHVRESTVEPKPMA